VICCKRVAFLTRRAIHKEDLAVGYIQFRFGAGRIAAAQTPQWARPKRIESAKIES
jgi:hypothetical protein